MVAGEGSQTGTVQHSPQTPADNKKFNLLAKKDLLLLVPHESDGSQVRKKTVAVGSSLDLALNSIAAAYPPQTNIMLH